MAEKVDVVEAEAVPQIEGGHEEANDDNVGFVQPKASLSWDYSRQTSCLMVAAILVNFAMLVYAQLSANAQIKFSLREDEEIILDIQAGCDGVSDRNIINANASLRDQLNVVGFQLGIDCTIGLQFDLVQCFQERLVIESGGLSNDCVACAAQFTQCMQNECLNPECRLQGGGTDQELCEVCINEKCEFELETCSGFQFYPDDAVVDTCLTPVDGAVRSGALFDTLPLFLAEIEVDCVDGNDPFDVCLRQQLFDQFALSDDCMLCLDSHADCVLANCEQDCTGANATLAECELCVEGTQCAAEFNLCSGVDRYNVVRALTEADAPTAVSKRNLQQQAEFGDDGCLDKDGVPLFDTLELTFIDSIARALDGGSIGLALLLLIFSGVWPHAKNLIMLYVWFIPMRQRSRTKLLRVFSVLLSWSLVDVFAVVLIANGSLIQKQLASGIAFLLFIEPRPGVYFFGITALWAIAQVQVIRHLNDKSTSKSETNAALSPTFKQMDSFRKKKGLLAFLSVVSAFATIIAALLPNLEMTLIGEIAGEDTLGLNEYEYNVFQLGLELFSDCSIFNEHGSVAGAYFLGLLFILLVVVIPTIAALQLFFVASKVNIVDLTPKAKRAIKRANVLGSFAALDVWLVTLFVFSNQFAGLIRGSVGDENNCGLSDEQVENGEICVGLEGKVGLGGFVMIAAVVTFWVAQCLAVSLVKAAEKYSK